jgi:hypothetical protein
MIRLDDFEEAIAFECRNNPDGPEEDDVALLMQKAARDLLNRQAIHGDDSMLKTTYRLLRRHSSYFERLFDGLGYRMQFDTSYAYALLLPGEIDVGSRRGKVSKEETLMLFALRVLWEECSREGEMDDFGRIESDTEILYDRFSAMTDADFPSKGRLKEYFNAWKSRGLLRVGAEDRDEELIYFTIMPVIRDLVTPDIAAEVEIYLASPEGSEDVLTHIEEVRAAPQDTTSDMMDEEESENV